MIFLKKLSLIIIQILKSKFKYNLNNKLLLIKTVKNLQIINNLRNMDSIEERHLLRLGMGGEKFYGEK